MCHFFTISSLLIFASFCDFWGRILYQCVTFFFFFLDSSCILGPSLWVCLMRSCFGGRKEIWCNLRVDVSFDGVLSGNWIWFLYGGLIRIYESLFFWCKAKRNEGMKERGREMRRKCMINQYWFWKGSNIYVYWLSFLGGKSSSMRVVAGTFFSIPSSITRTRRRKI